MVKELPHVKVTDDEFQRLNFCIRMADSKLAVETILKNIVKTCVGYLEENKKWLHMQPNERRAELFAVLKIGSGKLDDFARRLMDESKKTSSKRAES